MHVEISVALNFLISYLYNKLPRRRVDLLGEELEKGLKKKFEGHWYPDKPFKGSGFRCVRCNGENVDPVIVTAVFNAGLDLQEVKDYIPEEMTLWIDPSEVSYRISEKGPIKVLYTDRQEDGEASDTMDREVQAANHTFNPEALSFQPIDSISSSLSNLSLSPSSPVPPPGTWSSSSVSPSSALFSSPIPAMPPQQQQPHHHPHPHPHHNHPHHPHTHPSGSSFQQPPAAPPVFMGKSSNTTPQFTAASFAATKFGSTKLKSQAKRPTRLSPTELGNYFRQQQRAGFSVAPSPQRPRSLSPRDPRLEFLMDKQTRLYTRGQLSPQGHHSLVQTLQHQQQHQQQQQQLGFPPSAPQGPASPNNGNLPLPHMGGGGGGAGDAHHHHHHSTSPHLSPNNGMAAFPEMLSQGSGPGLHSPAQSLSPEGHKTFLDGLQQLGAVHGYPGHLQHLLVAN
ncbi:uncharacterized protein LOC143299617 [Babylonia areolata]|uniref:uncharacterized protein LOC143299617 n=1 Tax=Babylonia areolata TaxID=304850 RepID=UPI003FD2E037